MTTNKTLTVFCDAGLANQLRVLVSGIAAAEATGRTFRMFWPRTPACSAAFHELFTNNWPVTNVEQLDKITACPLYFSGSPLGTI